MNYAPDLASGGDRPRRHAASDEIGSTSESYRRPLVIVIADDEPDTVNMLAVIMEDEGHLVHRIYKATDVMSTVRRSRPDVVILDIAMPEVTGYDLAQRIRSHFTAYRPLLIAVSGVYKRPNDATLSKLLGFDEHITKPADPNRILELIEPLTKRQP